GPHGEQGEVGQFYYQRFGSPTVAAAEAALGELDGGSALLFPSGAGATTALVLSLLEPGDTIALAGGGYYGTGVTFAALERWGVRVVEFDQTGPPPDGVQLVWLEAPSHPSLTPPNLFAAIATVRCPGVGGALSLTDAEADVQRKLQASAGVVLNAPSVGGVTSLIDSRGRCEGERLPPGHLRLSAGHEEPETLLADLEQA